jgi:hypothetical protein
MTPTQNRSSTTAPVAVAEPHFAGAQRPGTRPPPTTVAHHHRCARRPNRLPSESNSLAADTDSLIARFFGCASFLRAADACICGRQHAECGSFGCCTALRVVLSTNAFRRGVLCRLMACRDRGGGRPAGDQRPTGSQAAAHRTWLRAGGFEASDDPFLYDDSFLHDRVSRTDPYICCAGFSTLNTAPCGSVKTADRPTDGMSNGSTMTCPPPSAALVAAASASSTAK